VPTSRWGLVAVLPEAGDTPRYAVKPWSSLKWRMAPLMRQRWLTAVREIP